MLFARNLLMFVFGVLLQVGAGIWPKLAGAFLPPASLLLSAADIRSVLNGSWVKHMVIFVLAIVCQSFAALVPAAWGVGPATALLTAGGLLMTSSDIRRVFRGSDPPAPTTLPPNPKGP